MPALSRFNALQIALFAVATTVICLIVVGLGVGAWYYIGSIEAEPSEAPAIAVEPIILPTETPIPSPTPIPTVTETRTPTATNTRVATMPAVPTSTAWPTSVPVTPEQEGEQATMPGAGPLGTIAVDQWQLVIKNAKATPGKDRSRRNVVVFADLVNSGSQDTFTPLYRVSLSDSRARIYEYDNKATWAAEDRFGCESSASVNPDETRHICFAYDTPTTETSFALVAGSLAASWSGNISFALP